MEYIDKIINLDEQINENKKNRLTKNEFIESIGLSLVSFLFFMIGLLFVSYLFPDPEIHISIALGVYWAIVGNFSVHQFEKKYFKLGSKINKNLKFFYTIYPFLFLPYFVFLRCRKKTKSPDLATLEKEKLILLNKVEHDYNFLSSILNKNNLTEKENLFIKKYITPFILNGNDLSIEELKKELYLKNLESKKNKNRIINE